jgi:hypothetical protein
MPEGTDIDIDWHRAPRRRRYRNSRFRPRRISSNGAASIAKAIGADRQQAPQGPPPSGPYTPIRTASATPSIQIESDGTSPPTDDVPAANDAAARPASDPSLPDPEAQTEIRSRFDGAAPLAFGVGFVLVLSFTVIAVAIVTVGAPAPSPAASSPPAFSSSPPGSDGDQQIQRIYGLPKATNDFLREIKRVPSRDRRELKVA